MATLGRMVINTPEVVGATMSRDGECEEPVKKKVRIVMDEDEPMQVVANDVTSISYGGKRLRSELAI